MRFVILLILGTLQICSSSVLFRIKSNNDNITINSSYFLGTLHIPQSLIWPYLSNETLRIINESDQIWFEHDFTDPEISKYIYSCSFDKMSIKQRARIRAKSWSLFLNETKQNSNDGLNNLERWRQWFINNEFFTNKYLWRNRSIDNDTIFDHRVILEGIQKGITIGSLEALPNDCFQIENGKGSAKSSLLNYQIIYSRAYNCELVDDDFVKELFTGLDFNKMKKRNQQITEHIRKLLTNNPQQKYLFVVGAAHLFGNISIIQMLQDQYNNDYYITQVDSPSPNFPYQNCTDEEFQRLVDEISSNQNKTINKRFLPLNLY